MTSKPLTIKISSRSWLLHSDKPWDPRVSSHIHDLKQNKYTIQKASQELDNLVEKNPLAFFKLGYHLVPDSVFHPQKPKFSDWLNTAAKNLIVQNPIAFISDLKLHLNPQFDSLLPLLYDSLRSKLSALDAKSIKKKDPAIYKDVLKIVELISRKHPDYYVKELADEPEYSKFFANIGAEAYVLFELKKLAGNSAVDELISELKPKATVIYTLISMANELDQNGKDRRAVVLIDKALNIIVKNIGRKSVNE